MRLLVASDPAEVVAHIRLAFKGSGKTQKQAADHLGFTQKHMSQIVNGKNGITLPVLFRICDYLGITVAIVPKEGRSGMNECEAEERNQRALYLLQNEWGCGKIDIGEMVRLLRGDPCEHN